LQLAGEQREVVRLAEERGQVGGQRIDEILLFVGASVLDQVQVVAEALDAACAQSPDQAAVDHVALVRAQVDAGPVMDHAAHAPKVANLEDERAVLDGLGVAVAGGLRHRRGPPAPAPWPGRAAPGAPRASVRTPAARPPANTGIPAPPGSRDRKSVV